MRSIALVLVLGGCGFHATPGNAAGEGDDQGAPADAYVAIDGPPLTSSMPVCLGTFNKICVDPPTAAVTLAKSINTDNIAMCVAYTSTVPLDACVIAGLSITIASGQKIVANGNKKLVLIATTGDVTIDGTLDVASHASMQPGSNLAGAGADIGPCVAGTNATGPAGGFGGSFGGAGGSGGKGGRGGTGGISAAAFVPTELRAGCPGGDGQGNGGGHGRGGGAVYLLARSAI